jgi:DNA-binding beta-propeller fold protein YncE
MVAVKSRPFTYSHTIGMLAVSGRGFSNPVDLTLGENGTLYVLNRSNSQQGPMGAVRVGICTVDGEFVGQFSTFGEEDGQLTWPTAIDRDAQGNLYVSDEHRHDVQVFDSQGNFLRKWGGFGAASGRLDRPSGLAVEADGNVLVVDHRNNRIQRFSPEGQPLAAWGTAGNGPGEFNLPWGVCVDGAGDVYVADWRNDRVQKFSRDGAYLATIGDPGSGDGELKRPANVEVAGDGQIYVADWGNDRVVVFTPEGYPSTALYGDATMSTWGAEFLAANADLTDGRKIMADGTPEKRLWGPTAVAVDDQGRVLIVDSCRHRIQIYERSQS